jgi:hypothetical protein
LPTESPVWVNVVTNPELAGFRCHDDVRGGGLTYQPTLI